MLIVISEHIYENSPHYKVGAMETALININTLASDALLEFKNQQFVISSLKQITSITKRFVEQQNKKPRQEIL